MIDIDYCEWMTGLPKEFYTLLVGIETTGDYVQFYVDAPVHVDWGSGKFLIYEAGIVYGKQENPYSQDPIIVRSVEEVTVIRFGTQSYWDRNYLEINIARAKHLTDAERMCYRLEELTSFKFFGNNQIASFESAWEDCTELLVFEGMDTTRAVTFKRAWKNCNKLNQFPNIYSKECLTVEESWMGCTALIEFPRIDIINCENFDSAWRGCENLSYFPYLDTDGGTSFDHTWAYCTDLTYFPALNFEKSLNMNFTFAYMKSIRNMPIINSKISTTFLATFKQMCSMRCIAGVNSISIASRSYSTEMFAYTPTLLQPGSEDQYNIEGGATWLNPDACFYDAGRSVFFVHIETLPSHCTDIAFTVHGGDFEIDWGDGLYLHYNEGYIANIPIDNVGINIRSEEDITSIEFHTDVMTNVEFKRAQTVTSVDSMLKDFKILEYFEILGSTLATDYTSVLSGCSNLVRVGEMDLSKATTVYGLFRDCISLEDVGLRYYDTDNEEYVYDELDMSMATDLTEMFYGCEEIQHIQKCITPIGENFTRMYANTDALNCIDGVDTRNDVTTTEMFYQTPVLLRPTNGEQDLITAVPGILFDNLGNCGGPVAILFYSVNDGVDTVTFQLDGAVTVDWGNGSIIDYPANTVISGVPLGQATILGEGTTIDWQTDNVDTVVFVRADNIVDMTSMFENHSALKYVEFVGDSYVVDYTSMFKNSGLIGFIAPDDLSHGITFTGMFHQTASLDWVTAMNTVNATDVEYMFADSGLQCLKEVNTLNAVYPPVMLVCASDLVCASTLECYTHSTMFDNTTPNFPTADEITLILNHYHWIGTTPCEP